MVAGNPCYGGEIPSLPSRTTSAANNFKRFTQGEPPLATVTQPGDSIRITVGRCYEATAPVVTNTPTPANAPRNTIPRPPTINDTTPPPAATAADLIRVVVDNCYGDEPIPLTPANKGAYPRNRQGEPETIQGTPAGAVIRQIVDQCYGPDLSLTPRPPGPPRNRQGEDDVVPGVSPGQVIRDIVDRCYPSVPDIEPPDDLPDDAIDVILTEPTGPTDWLCDLFPDLWICKHKPIGPVVPIGPLGPNIPYPQPEPKNDDCKEVIEGLANETVEISSDPTEAEEGIYYVLETGEKLQCKGLWEGPFDKDDDGDKRWEKCVKDAVNCIFKPYVTGTYRTPGADCSSFYFRGQNSTTGEICVQNCYPERIAVYEYIKGGSAKNVQITPFANEVDGTNSNPRHSTRVMTTDTMGNWNGGKVPMEGGNRYFTSTSEQTHTMTLGGASVTFKVKPVLDGNEYDSTWWVTGWSGNLPSEGTTSTYTFSAGRNQMTVEAEVLGGVADDHRYGFSATPDLAGYSAVSTEPAFYILKNQVQGSIPLFRFYSSSTTDTFLTTNPGKPDSKGTGERATMNAAGMTQGEIFGYVFKDPSKALNALTEGEKAIPLHRYYKGTRSELTAEFNSSNNLVVSGSGSGRLKIEVKWNDNPSTAGTAFETISCNGFSVTRRGRRGSASGLIDVTGGQTYQVNITGYQGGSRRNNNQELCLRDGHGSDCNANVKIGGMTGGSTNGDHKYSTVLTGQPSIPVEYENTRLSYRIQPNAQAPAVISYHVKKGGAGHQNSWGVAIANKAGDQIYWAKVIQQNVTRDIDLTQYKIPQSVLRQYPGKDIVFFLIPDGNRNGVPSGNITFTQSGDGWKHSSSNQSNWVFFSNKKMNPGNRSKVRYQGNNWQWWEDLLNGDDDYDDFKVYYEFTQPGGTYDYEGIQCYVFGEPAPEPVKIPVIVRQQCDSPLFESTFQDITLGRGGCGGPVPNEDNGAPTIGKCNGPYAAEVNRNQTIKATRSASLELKAYGAFIRAPESEEMKVKIQFQKNGSNILQKSYKIGDWPQVGQTLASVSVAAGDTLSFNVTEISRGPAMGHASLGMILYEPAAELFEKPWNMKVFTTPGATEAQGRSIVTSNTPNTSNNVSGGDGDLGRIKKLQIQLWDHRTQEWTDPVRIWNNGQIDTNNANGQDAQWTNEYYGGDEWAVGKDSRYDSGAGLYEGGTNSRNSHILSSQHDSDGQWTGRDGDRGIYYNTLFEAGRGLICKPSRNKGDLRSNNYYHHSNGDGFTSWFTQVDSNNWPNHLDAVNGYYATGINNGGGFPLGSVVNSNGQYSKMSFMHDYVLGELPGGVKVTDNKPDAKIRLAFWPYTVPDEDYDDGDPRFGNNVFWACAVECFDVVNRGTAYQAGQTFVSEWPPVQPDKPRYQNRGGQQTPYYPRDPGGDEPLPNEITVRTRGIEDRVSRRFDEDKYTPREVIYQESHNRDSNLWYICQNRRKLDRVAFKITIEEVE